MVALDPAYQRAHWAVVRARGEARGHPCIGCGKPAIHWAYQHQAAQEMISSEGWPYSWDPADYEPMCRSCHKRLDLSKMSKEDAAALLQSQIDGGSSAGCSRLRRCDECGLVSHQAGVGRHQKASGHVGHTDVKEEIMRVNIYETIEISDEQRLMLGAILSGQQKPKYNASRDEIKRFVWENGIEWEDALAEEHSRAFPAEPDAADEDADEDTDDDGDDDDLI